MAHLQGKRVLFGHDAPLGQDRRPPAVALVAPDVQTRYRQGALGPGEQVAELVRVRVRLVLTGGQLPAPWRGRAIGNGERPERAAGEAQDDGCGILDRKAAS